MLNKKTILLAIFLISLLAVSAVSAADNTTENIANTDDSNECILDEPLDISSVSTTDNSEEYIANIDNEIISDDSGNDDLNFRNLSDKINSGNEITLEKNYKFDPNTDLNYKNLTIDSNLISIDGKGHYIDGNNQFENINITGSNILFKNITFKNFNSKSASFLINGIKFTFENCTFDHMIANKIQSGIIPIVESIKDNLTITNCNFINNDADLIIAMNGKYGKVTNSNFTQNTVNNILINVNGENCNITRCAFKDHTGRPIQIANENINCYIDNGIYDFYLNVSDKCEHIGSILEGRLATLEYFGTRLGNISIKFKGVESFNRKIRFNESLVPNWTDFKKIPDGSVNITISFISDDAELVLHKGTIKLNYTLEVGAGYGDPELQEHATNKIEYNGYGVFHVELPRGATGDLSISYGNTNKNNVKYDKNRLLYNFTIQGKNFKVGLHTITVRLSNDPIYGNKTTLYVFYVLKAKTAITVQSSTQYYGSNGNVIVTLKDDNGKAISGAKLSIKFNGKVYTPITDKNGQVKISTKGLNPKLYIAIIKFAGNSNYLLTLKTALVTVNRAKTNVLSSPVTTVYKSGKYIVATLKNQYGKPMSGVKLTIKLSNGKTFNPTTNKNGQVKVSTNKLAPKAYTAKITFEGNNKYVKSTKSVKVTVKKATPKITAKKKTFKAKKKVKKYKITLKDNKGKPIKKAKVTLKIKKKTFKAKTNKKGKATFKIKKLTKKGKYPSVVKFKSNEFYKKATKKVKIRIK